MTSPRRIVSTSQILFGTDFTYGSAEGHARNLAGCGLCGADVRAIECENTWRLFPRFAPRETNPK